MSRLGISPPTVTRDGAEDIKKAATHAAACLARIISASSELKVPEVLGELPVEYLGQIGRVMRAESRANQVLELTQNGKSLSEAAREVGITPTRAYQIRKAHSPELRRAVERILDFLGDHDAPDDVCDAINMIATPAARKIFEKVASEG